MIFKIDYLFSAGLLLLAIVSAPVSAGEIKSSVSEKVPVTLDNFATAETHFMMQLGIDTQNSFGKWFHDRGFTPIERQNVVRMNRDTLYSSVVLDLTEPATIIKPDTQGRYQSLLVVNEGHFATLVAYKPGKYRLTNEKMGSRYVAVIVRTLVDAEDPNDLDEAHKAQDGLKLIQKSIGKFEVPNWDRDALKEMRDALKVLGKYLPIRDTAYGGSIEEVDPIAHIVGTADTWGGWKPENAVYRSYVPQNNDGKTPYTLTLKNVPAAKDAFWSISVYNSDGFFQENEYNKYVINSRKAKTDKDGSVMIHFGGDSSKDNFLPIMPGWNYMLRIYLPQKPYFDGTWKAPEAKAVK